MVRPEDKIPGCQYFTWKEALWLPRWNRCANEQDGLTPEIIANLTKTFQWMDKIRVYFGAPISVHVAYRPDAYNKLVGGAKTSTHMAGKAVDFSVKGMTCEAARQKILKDNKLEELKLRMENNGVDANWIHLDDREVGPAGRFFKP